MNIAIIGATGFVGSAILNEALNRGHQVTALVRNPGKLSVHHEHLKIVKTDILNIGQVKDVLSGNDAVISAYNSGWSNPNIYDDFIAGSKAIQQGVKESGVKRLIVIGGAGSLEIKPGLQLIDTPDFPEAYKPGASAARDYLNIIRQENELDWTYFSPAPEMNVGNPGTRTGKYRTSKDTPVFDEQGRSKLSVEDLAVAVLDELEKPAHIRERFTAAY